jgi:hypothetical protein
MGVPSSEVCYTSATTGRRDHEVHKGHVVELEKKKIRTRNLFSVSSSRELWRLWHNEEKYGGASGDYYTTYAYCMLANCGYKHTLSIYNYYSLIFHGNWLRERASMLRYTYTVCHV